jgi:hypothetical protein
MIQTITDTNNKVWYKVKHYNLNNEYTHYTFQLIKSLPFLPTTYKTSQGYF